MPKIVACYCRVSTTEQNRERQLGSTTGYAQEQLGAEVVEIETYWDKATGTNTSWSDYREMMKAVDRGEIDTVVVHETFRLVRSPQDLDVRAELHFVRDLLPPFKGDHNPMARLMLQMLGAFAEWEARTYRMNGCEGIAVRQREDGYHHDRLPIGFEKIDGQFVEAEDYNRVVAVLEVVQNGELSKRKAASESDISRSTIGRPLKRTVLYGLSQVAQ